MAFASGKTSDFHPLLEYRITHKRGIHCAAGYKRRLSYYSKMVYIPTCGLRHTYSALLKANGEDVKVVQELMLHANISTTMNIYAKALTPAKREAQSRVVDVLWIDRGKPQKGLRRMQHQNQRIESVSRFFCESAKLLV
jgi:integrase